MAGTVTQNAIGRRRWVIHHMGVYEATLARLQQHRRTAWCCPPPSAAPANRPPGTTGSPHGCQTYDSAATAPAHIMELVNKGTLHYQLFNDIVSTVEVA